ncbi:S-methyl-5-thioribose-1-phosphate isomerase [Geranomyces michiganensis]|nr:S-methyl-5-thioribose-1-phosphate isomerase [Geranomyces michiganensis]
MWLKSLLPLPLLLLLVRATFAAALPEPQNIIGIGSSGQPRFRATELPDLTPYGTITTLATNGGGRYSFGSYLEDENNVRFYLALENMAFGMPWMGIGFGRTMLDADFIVGHLYANNTVEMHEHVPRNQYGPPFPMWNPNAGWVMTAMNGGYVNGIFFLEVRRPLVPDPRPYSHMTLLDGKDGKPQRMIWAYTPASDRNHWRGFFAYHGENPGSQTGLPTEPNQTHGWMSVNYDQKAVVDFHPIPNRARRVAHGSGMFVAWLVLFPGGAYYSRYMRFLPRWIWVHAILQCLGLGLLVACFLTIVVTLGRIRIHAHSILGLTMLSLLALQLLGGLTNRALLRTDLPRTRRRSAVKLFHRTVGYVLILMAVAQVGLGMHILYPIEEPRGDAFWIVYFLVVGFWVFLFVGTEACRRLLFVVKTRPNGSMVEDGPIKYHQMGQHDGISELSKRQGGRLYPDLKSYDWQSLDEAVTNGSLLVVADGRYVYDVSKWIFSHPGGQQILLNVAGTDVTSDYFNEAGYDAAEFTPPPIFPEQDSRRQAVSLFHDLSDQKASSQISLACESFTNEASLVLTQTDWYRITRARRTHVHTKLAIMRLAHLLVGELIPNQQQRRDSKAETIVSNDSPTTSSPTSHKFDPFEYRRYALTQKELLTDGSAASTPIWRLRFCLLYPYEGRDGQPMDFLPGQCVEFQARVNGVPAARYYTPVSGNITAFDVWVKHTTVNAAGSSHHAVSAFLCHERPGECQYKIRGPFGQSLLTPLLPAPPPVPTVSPSSTMPLLANPSAAAPSPMLKGSILFVTGGSGITPFLQLLQYLFLPTGVPLKAASSYEPVMPDELRIQKGDVLVIQKHYYDGWSYATNSKTGKEGVIPLPKTVPRHGPCFKLVLLNCVHAPGDLIGAELIDAVLLAYPRQFEVHHVIKTGVEDGCGQFSGFGYGGELSGAILAEAVSGASCLPGAADDAAVVGSPNTVAEGGDATTTTTTTAAAAAATPVVSLSRGRPAFRKAYICGRPDFNAYVRDELESNFEYDAVADITLLSNSSPTTI